MALIPSSLASIFFLFFFNDTATTEIYTLSLHDALPISQLQTAVAALAYTLRARRTPAALSVGTDGERPGAAEPHDLVGDRKSTRLNSSHGYISYAVFCLKKKKNKPAEKQITDQVERANH